MGEAKGREKTNEAGGADRGSTGGLSSALEDQGLVRGEENLKRKSIVREYAEAIIIAVILALFIRTFVVQAFKIPSGSMKQTLYVGDHILVNKFLYGISVPFTDTKFFPIREPEPQDIIVFKYPEDETKDFIKRVVGTPGDKVEVIDKVVYINQVAQSEKYAIHTDPYIYRSEEKERDNFGPIVVPEDSYFVMGDNRDQSLDSRFWGFVKRNKVEGRAFIIYWSVDSTASWLQWIRWNRIGKMIS